MAVSAATVDAIRRFALRCCFLSATSGQDPPQHYLNSMHAAALNLRHAADASRIDAAVRACVAGLSSRRALGASSLLLSLTIGCRA